jgi:hypothetical protein
VDYLPWKGKGDTTMETTTAEDACVSDSDDGTPSTMLGMDITRRKGETAEQKKLRKVGFTPYRLRCTTTSVVYDLVQL